MRFAIASSLAENPGKSNLKLQTYITLVTQQQYQPHWSRR